MATSTEYYAQAAQWRYQIFESQRVWLQRAFLLIGLLLVLLLLTLMALIMLLPLKQKVPYLYSVNTVTGELTQIGELEPRKLAADWSMTRFLLIRYVTARESFDSDNIDYPYQIAWAMSDKNTAAIYEKEASDQNPHSPYNQYGKQRYVTVQVLSAVRLNDNTASVRFLQRLHDRDSDRIQQIQKEAIIKWRYTTPVMAQPWLDRDPLGFKVFYYQTTPVSLATV